MSGPLRSSARRTARSWCSQGAWVQARSQPQHPALPPALPCPPCPAPIVGCSLWVRNRSKENATLQVREHLFLFFWSKRWHQKDILKLTDLYQKVKNYFVLSIRGHSTTTWTRRGGGGVNQKSTLFHPGGGPLNVHVDQNLAMSESILYHCEHCKKEIIWTIEWIQSSCNWKLKVCTKLPMYYVD